MRINLARGLIGLVILVNLQCAALFLLAPGRFSPGFQLSGYVGDAVIRGFGVLFLMWNIPYVVALWHPIRHWVSLLEAVAMQFIGVVGESLIYSSVPGNLVILRSSLIRFITFDLLGLLALLAAAWVIRKAGQHDSDG
jgi:hypothetical protein